MLWLKNYCFAIITPSRSENNPLYSSWLPCQHQSNIDKFKFDPQSIHFCISQSYICSISYWARFSSENPHHCQRTKLFAIIRDTLEVWLFFVNHHCPLVANSNKAAMLFKIWFALNHPRDFDQAHKEIYPPSPQNRNWLKNRSGCTTYLNIGLS